MRSEFEFNVKVSFIEIYNEYIRDLLIDNNAKHYLELRDDNDKGIVIAGVTEKEVHNVDDIMRLLFIGNSKRTTEATKANTESSRSHAVLQVNVVSRPATKNIRQEVRMGK